MRQDPRAVLAEAGYTEEEPNALAARGALG